MISSDSATCDDCLRELFDPTNRRFLYPFINCTNCGPRFTIVQDVPYDRDKTTMSSFSMCPECLAEYVDPLNRRFHAQPNACQVCGPEVYLLDWECDASRTPNPVREKEAIWVAAQKLASGAVLALKGLGGLHLVCDARNPEAVQKLRQRKHREAKPFALMVADVQTARSLCLVSSAEEHLLQSPHRPIVLLEQKAGCRLAPEVAPGYLSLGLMLPYTPLHYLLLHASAEEFGGETPPVLVMTSGNVSEEPIVYDDDEAWQRLGSIADALLTHNRTIHMRCDDSVVRAVPSGTQFLRRSRGFAPEPISLTPALPLSLLACGGHLKNTFCLGKGQQAFVSHHIGDLENYETLTSFREGIAHYQRLFDIYPQAIVHDLHSGYLSTKYALDADLPQKIGVQHHHAHIASVMAEHHLNEPVIGVAADGTGFGTDGAIWGCEILLAELADFQRLAHLAYIPLPGGDSAVRQPWRIAAAYLAQTYGEQAFLDLSIPFVQQLDRAKWHTLSVMIARRINCPLTSSLGRLFDAVAALLNIRQEVIYEGQAAIELEALAMEAEKEANGKLAQSYPFALTREAIAPNQTILDVQPLICAPVQDLQYAVPVAQIARRFHATIAELLIAACLDVHRQTGLIRVALSGGVFQNLLLLNTVRARLEESSLQVFINHQVPPNDGGLSLGQLAVAAARLRRE